MEAELLPRYEALLNADDQRQLAQIQRQPARMTFLASRALRNSVLAEKLNCAPNALQFARDENDKPYLLDASNLHFNVSHCRDWIALALSEIAPVGVDVEVCDRSNNILGIAKRFFQEDEYELLAALPLEQRAETFCNLWTLKEACVKWSGMGIGRALAGVGVNLQAGKILLSLRADIGFADAIPQARLMQLAPNVRLAVVSATTVSPSVFQQIPLRRREALIVPALANS